MYADFWIKDGKMGMRPVPSAERIREAYNALGQKKGYRTLKQNCPIMATWDDHDYGANDMGNDFDLRKESQLEFIRFYGFDDDHPINQQQGIYNSQIFGPQGNALKSSCSTLVTTVIHLSQTKIDRADQVRTKRQMTHQRPYWVMFNGNGSRIR